MTQQEFIKELKELYKIAKEQKDVSLSLDLLNKLKQQGEK